MIAVRILALAIGDAEAAADVDMADVVAVGAQRRDEIGGEAEGVVERRKIGDLRADMDVDAGRP